MSRLKTRTEHTMGRPRVVGQRLPSLEQVLQNTETVWQKLTLDWYGQGKRTLEICDFHSIVVPLWLRSFANSLGLDPRSIGQASSLSAIFSTNPTQAAEQIIKDAHEALEPGSDV
jgi:hypothetical protein